MAFRLVSARLSGQSIPLSNRSRPTSSDTENRCTIVLGRNGVGKSRLLAGIARLFASFDDGGRLPRDRAATRHRNRRDSDLVLTYIAEGRRVRLRINGPYIESSFADKGDRRAGVRVPLPKRVIATTITPSDKFPVSNTALVRQRDASAIRDSEEKIYRYLGGKSGGDSISIRNRLSRVVDALVRSVTKSNSARAKLVEVFQLLNYQPKVQVEYGFRFGRLGLSEVREHLEDPDKLRERVRSMHGLPHRWRLIELALNNDEKLRVLREAIMFAEATLDQDYEVSAAIDIRHGSFLNDSEAVFRHLQVLEAYRIASIADLRLFRDTTDLGLQKESLFEETDAVLPLSITEASSGEQAVLLTLLGIAAEIEDNSLVLLDEPEISLHPEWQERIISLLVDTFSGYRGCHFVIATHSPQVLAHAGHVASSVVVLDKDDVSISSGAALLHRSADFQLATIFRSPGYRNEYLAREALAALTLASRGDVRSSRFNSLRNMLQRARVHMREDDPIAQMVDAVVQASEMMNP